MMEDFEDHTPMRTKELVYNDVTYILSATDPYGLWTIRSKSGSTADWLKGNYTSISEAEKAVVRYHSAKTEATRIYNETVPGKKESKALAAAKRHEEYLKLKQEMDSKE